MSFEAAFVDGFVGIVAGILTAVVLYAGKLFLEHVVLPAYRESRYQGVLLAGQWFGMEEEEGSSSEMTVLLEQIAHDIKGTFRLQHVSEPNSFDLDFKVTGYIWEGYITLNLRPSNRGVTSYATGLLKVSSGGKALIGEVAYRHANDDCVRTMPIFLWQGPRSIVRQQMLTINAQRDLQVAAERAAVEQARVASLIIAESSASIKPAEIS